MTPMEVINWCEARHIRLYAQGERLRYQAPAGAVTVELARRLKTHKAAILEALRQPLAANDSQADAASTSVPPPKQSLEVCCGDCQHFESDRIGDGTGIGQCLAGCVARPGLNTPLYPQALRRCNHFSSKEATPC